MKTIQLTTDEVLKQALLNKLSEYISRYTKDQRLSTCTKISVLFDLFLFQEIEYENTLQRILNYLPQEFQYTAPEIIKSYFDNAWWVIEDYNLTGWLNNRGWTGLQ